MEAADYWGNAISIECGKPSFVAKDLTLLQNVPNPLNASTRITFVLSEAGDVTLTVYDVMGRKVRTLIQEPMEPGPHHVIWDARNDNGGELASGVYFCRLETARSQASRKMVLLK
jgi:flagellar hook assembly protein FlgD